MNVRVEAKPGPLLEGVLKFLHEAGLAGLENPVLPVQTGEIETVVGKRGAISTHRLDILLGPSPSRGGEHLITPTLSLTSPLPSSFSILPSLTLSRLSSFPRRSQWPLWALCILVPFQVV